MFIFLSCIPLFCFFTIPDILDDEDDYDADSEDIDSKLMPPPPPPILSTSGKKEEPAPPSTNGKDTFISARH